MANLNLEKENFKGYLTDYVESVTREDKRGGRNKYVCPICGSGTRAGANHNGAFTVFPNNKWKCFSCGAGGDIYDLIGRIEHISTFTGQLERAAELFNGVEPKKPETKERKITMDFKDYIEECKQDITETEYFKQRGLKDTIVKEFNLGYDKARKSVVIPYNKQGTYYIARSTAEKRFRKPKMETAGAEPIFNEEALEDTLPCFVTESPIDALSIMQEGLFNAIALGGTGTAKLEQKIKATRPNCGLILAFDNDDAGRRATVDASKLLEKYGITFEIAEWSICDLGFSKYPAPMKDANDLLRGNEEQFRLDLARNADRLEAALEIKESEVGDIIPIGGEMRTFREAVKGMTKVETGIKGLDTALNGGLGAGLYILGAEPSFGKTTLALQIASNIAQEKPVMFFTMEMSKNEIIAKSLSRKTCVTFSEILTPIKGEDGDSGDIGTFTITADVRTSEAVNIPVAVSEKDGTGIQITFSTIELAEVGKWTHIRSTAQGSGVDRNTQVLVFDLSAASSTNAFDIANLKIEAGESGTDWKIGLANMAAGQSNVSTTGNGEDRKITTDPYFTLGKRGDGDIGAYSFAVGDNAVAGGDHSVAIGDKANARFKDGIALGNNVTANHESVAIGKDCYAAYGDVTIGQGLRTFTGRLLNFCQHVVGQYNEIEFDGRFRGTVFMVGAGYDNDNRRTVFKVNERGDVEATGLINEQQAGRVLLKNTGETKTINGTTYNKLAATVNIPRQFDAGVTPMIFLTPISGAPYRLTPPTVDNVTNHSFDIIMFRNNNTETTVQWLAVRPT